MCDTMVALANSTADSRVLFAKNADRQPNERLLTVRVPAGRHPTGSRLTCTYMELEQAQETYEVILLKPHWMWGAEMGANEHGLVIGNEAVFTKEPKGPPRLIGMDMLRLALERCQTSREALDLMVDLLERYGQGGNCGFEKKFTYHNAFLIADRQEAWVLETAGAYWAALKVRDLYSISNRLSIGRDFDLAHPRLIQHAIDKGWCKDSPDFDFARCYSEPVFTFFSGSAKRRQASQSHLEGCRGRITEETLIEILRGHQPSWDKKPYRKSSVSSVCMHAGFLFGDQTTGSLVASLGEPRDTYWLTGGGPACLGLFKPFFFVEGESLTFDEEDPDQAMAAWEARESIHRLAIQGRIDPEAFIHERNLLEEKSRERVRRLSLTEASEKELAAMVNQALFDEKELLGKYRRSAGPKRVAIRGNPYFRRYWKKTIARL